MEPISLIYGVCVGVFLGFWGGLLIGRSGRSALPALPHESPGEPALPLEPVDESELPEAKLLDELESSGEADATPDVGDELEQESQVETAETETETAGAETAETETAGAETAETETAAAA